MKADELEGSEGTAVRCQKQEEFIISGKVSPLHCWLYNGVAPKVKYNSLRHTVELILLPALYCTMQNNRSINLISPPVPVSVPPDSL